MPVSETTIGVSRTVTADAATTQAAHTTSQSPSTAGNTRIIPYAAIAAPAVPHVPGTFGSSPQPKNDRTMSAKLIRRSRDRSRRRGRRSDERVPELGADADLARARRRVGADESRGRHLVEDADAPRVAD